MSNINYGIDLGTTNSGICKCVDGKVKIFKNPVGFSDTLPSVIAFRKNRMLVGEKARELMKTANSDVFSSFKRKMGTEHQFTVRSSETNISPVELSSLILKELISFVPDEKPESMVITIPASFDTVQSNATKLAGQQAGFQQVVLLQEPIAACLAYANEQNIEHKEEKKWLVYDFGGGTFDVALVRINERELKIIDHEGNNFLGGIDLDHLVIEKLLVPKIETMLAETDLFKKMVANASNNYTKLYYELLYKAEEIKKELSLKECVDTDLELNDGDDYVDFTISRHEFNSVIKEKVDESLHLIQKLLDDNQLSTKDIERIILVGGTTYIPFIREELYKRLQITVDHSIDPTTAVMVGAAYFAGTKEQLIKETVKEFLDVNDSENAIKFNFNLIYEVNSQDNEELIMGVADENFRGFYRIVRKDGGFDTGMTAFRGRFNEFVTITPKYRNQFSVQVFDEQHNVLFEQTDVFINHGVYNISGQPLPNDICLEVDDPYGDTMLETIFKKNAILPLRKTIYKTTSKNFNNQLEDKLIINILEGKSGTLPASNMSIGYIEINSKDFPMNLLKGMDIELNFSMSESRDLSVSVYISSIDFELKEVFNPHTKNVNKDKFQEDINKVISEIDDELRFNDGYEDMEMSEVQLLSQLRNIRTELFKIKMDLVEIEDNTSTDQIFILDEKKRRTLQQYDHLVRFRNVLYEIDEYKREKEDLEKMMEDASPRQLETYRKIIKDEKAVLESNEKALIKRKTQELVKLSNDIYFKKDEAYISVFYHYKYINLDQYKDEKQAERLIESGNEAIQNGNLKELPYISGNLYNLLIDKPKDSFEEKDGNLGLK